jgi:hypothetical protein
MWDLATLSSDGGPRSGALNFGTHFSLFSRHYFGEAHMCPARYYGAFLRRNDFRISALRDTGNNALRSGSKAGTVLSENILEPGITSLGPSALAAAER